MPKGTYIRQPWTDAETRILLDHYAQRGPAFCAEMLIAAGHRPRTRRAIGLYGRKLGLRYTGPRLTQYKPGTTPHNKGKKMRPETYRDCAPTMFKKGCLSGRAAQLHQPIGAKKFRSDGYWYTKVSDHQWKYTHRLLWEQHHGPIPAGHIVRFRDGNPHNLHIQNLELITRAQHATRCRWEQPSQYALLSDRPAKQFLKKQGIRKKEIQQNPALLELSRAHTLINIKKRHRHARTQA